MSRTSTVKITLAIALTVTAAFAQEAANDTLAKAQSLLAAGKIEQAVSLLDHAIGEHPNDADLLNLRGTARQQAGDMDGALADFTAAIKANPKSVAAYFNRGALGLGGAQLDQAISDLEQVTKLRPDEVNARFLTAIAYYKKGDLKATEGAAQGCIAHAIDHAEAHCLLGMTYLQGKQARQALAEFQRALFIKNDYPMAYYGKGQALDAIGDAYSANEMRAIACGLSPYFCDQEKLKDVDESLLIANSQSLAESQYCVCCVIHDSPGKHREDKVQALLKQQANDEASRIKASPLSVDFHYSNRYLESGITFEQRCTEDSGREWRPVHYDHGSGINVADVDGDGIEDVLFLTQIGENQLWRGNGDGTFENLSQKAGIALADQISVAAAFGDIDNDGDPDLYITTVRQGNHLFENTGDGAFRDVTKTAGLGDGPFHSSGALFLDYDNDGHLDLFVINVGNYTLDQKGNGGYFVGRKDAFGGHLHPDRAEASRLYRNMGDNTFELVNGDLNFNDKSWAGDASIVDLNGDRYPDIYMLNMQGDDNYYENHAGKSFVNLTASRFKATPWGAMGMEFFDADNDGDMDLYLTDMHSDMTHKIGPEEETQKSDMQWDDQFLQGGANNVFGNAFYRNMGDQTFEEQSDEVGLEQYWPWGLSVGDLNADGFEDIFVAASMNFPWRYATNKVYLNERGKTFVDAEFALGVEPRPKTVKPWFAVDCGTPEGRRNDACKGQNGVTVVWGALGTRSSVLFDIDNDGDLDIVTNEFNAEPQVLVSNLADQKKIAFLKVRLEGTKSNRDGFGAKVTVHAGDQTFTQYYDGKSGYLSHSLLPLYFGLGSADKVDSIDIAWPSGTDQTLTHPGINQLLHIKEPAE